MPSQLIRDAVSFLFLASRASRVARGGGTVALLGVVLAACGGGSSGTGGGGGSGGSGASSSSSSSGGTTCAEPDTSCDAVFSAFTACGGDPKGTWTLQSLCSKPKTAPLDMDCPTGTNTTTIIGGTGDLTIDDTMFSKGPSIADAQFVLEAPTSCFPVDCKTVETGYKMQDPNACCDTVGTDCVCIYGYKADTDASSLAYTLNGNNLTIGAGDIEFCVANGQLSLRTLGGTPDEVVQVYKVK